MNPFIASRREWNPVTHIKVTKREETTSIPFLLWLTWPPCPFIMRLSSTLRASLFLTEKILCHAPERFWFILYYSFDRASCPPRIHDTSLDPDSISAPAPERHAELPDSFSSRSLSLGTGLFYALPSLFRVVLCLPQLEVNVTLLSSRSFTVELRHSGVRT